MTLFEINRVADKVLKVDLEDVFQWFDLGSLFGFIDVYWLNNDLPHFYLNEAVLLDSNQFFQELNITEKIRATHEDVKVHLVISIGFKTKNHSCSNFFNIYFNNGVNFCDFLDVALYKAFDTSLSIAESFVKLEGTILNPVGTWELV